MKGFSTLAIIFAAMASLSAAVATATTIDEDSISDLSSFEIYYRAKTSDESGLHNATSSTEHSRSSSRKLTSTFPGNRTTVASFTTYLSKPTTFVTNNATYIAKNATWLTITDCPCVIENNNVKSDKSESHKSSSSSSGSKNSTSNSTKHKGAANALDVPIAAGALAGAIALLV